MEGLAVGRIVHYVDSRSFVLAAIITKIWNDKGMVNLCVFKDDYSVSGHDSELNTSVEYNEKSVPFTWHWPART